MATVPVALIAQLRAKADWHAAEAARYRTAAEVLATELQAAASPPVTSATNNPTPARRAVSGTPSALDLIEQIVATADRDRVWPVADLLEAMNERGWETNSAQPINTVRTAVSRLMSRGVLERAGTGAYRLAQATHNSHAGSFDDLSTPDNVEQSASEEAHT